LYRLVIQPIVIDLDDGVKVNYTKFGPALKKVMGLTGTEPFEVVILESRSSTRRETICILVNRSATL